MAKSLRAFVWFGVVAVAAATLAGQFGERSWLLDLANHFRPHLAALATLWLFLALALRRVLAVIASAALLAFNAAPLMPYVTGAPPIAPLTAAEGGTPLRLMAYNAQGRMHLPSRKRRALIEFVQSEQPDVILLTELPPNHDWLIDSLGADYPHRVRDATGSPHDLLLLSRWPIARAAVDRSVHPRLPVLAADICPEAGDTADGEEPSCARLVGLHAITPFGPNMPLRQGQFALATRLARAAPAGRAVLAGDLNLTPWAPAFARLLAEARLRDAAAGRGLTATWISRQPMVGLMIDHILASPALTARDYRVGPNLGSDHYPVLADLVIPQNAR